MNKTTETNQNITEFLDKITNTERRDDCYQLVEILTDLTGEVPKIWGSSIVGFGSYHYKYESGREGEWFETGFSPRKNNITLYIVSGLDIDLMKELGKYKSGKSCIYIKKLTDIDMKIYKKLILQSIEKIKELYGS